MCTLDLTFKWEWGFVYCHSRSTWAPNEDPRSNLCETWAHTSRAADTRQHSPLVETLSSDSCLNIPAKHKFSSALSLSWYQRPCQSDTSWEIGHKNFFFHTFIPQFFYNIHAHTEKMPTQAFAIWRCKCKDHFACIVQKKTHISGKMVHSANCNMSFLSFMALSLSLCINITAALLQSMS